MTNLAIQKAVNLLGRQSQLAEKVGVAAPTVNQWLTGRRPVPIERCATVEAATDGAVMRWDLRPQDWHLIWPELVSRQDAPPIPIKPDAVTSAAAPDTAET